MSQSNSRGQKLRSAIQRSPACTVRSTAVNNERSWAWPIFTRKDLAHQARSGLVDHQRLPGQGASLHPSECFASMRTRFHRLPSTIFTWEPATRARVHRPRADSVALTCGLERTNAAAVWVSISWRVFGETEIPRPTCAS